MALITFVILLALSRTIIVIPENFDKEYLASRLNKAHHITTETKYDFLNDIICFDSILNLS